MPCASLIQPLCATVLHHHHHHHHQPSILQGDQGWEEHILVDPSIIHITQNLMGTVLQLQSIDGVRSVFHTNTQPALNKNICDPYGCTYRWRDTKQKSFSITIQWTCWLSSLYSKHIAEWQKEKASFTTPNALHCPPLSLAAFSEANLKRSEHAWLIVCRSQSQHFIQRPL